MVKIRLMRVGKRKQPSFRVVVADSRSPRDGRIIEAIGHYQPRSEPSEVAIDNDRAVHWLRHGAQPSGQVRHLLEISGAWAAYTGETIVRTAPDPAEKKKRATPAASVTEPTDDDGEAEAPTGDDAPEAGAEERAAEAPEDAPEPEVDAPATEEAPAEEASDEAAEEEPA